MRKILTISFIILLISDLAMAGPLQLKVMPLGNSITRGVVTGNMGAQPDDIGYRKALFNSLKNTYTGLDFVGSLSHGDGSTGFDDDHEGHSGWRADEIRDNVKTWLNNNPADVVLLHIGTNDIFAGENLADIVDEVEQVLDKIDEYESESNSEVIVFVARIVRFLFNGTPDAVTTDFNDQVEAMVDQRILNGDKLYKVDQESAIEYPTGLEPDLIHPTLPGYEVMANRWENAITSTLAVPQITDPGIQLADVGQNFTYQIVASGVPTPVISVSNLPTGMTYDAATQTVSWVPAPGQAGPASFDVLASNALDNENLTINIDVDGPMVNPPTSSDTSVNMDEDETYTFAPADFPFNDPDNDNFDGIRVVSLPGEGSLDAGGAVTAGDIIADVTTLNFNPEPDANGMSYTSFTFKVRSDIGEESVADYTMTINVAPVNDLPLGADVSVTTDEDVTYTFQPGDFTFSDVDGDNFDGIRVVSLPNEGLLDVGGTAVSAGAVIADVTTLNFIPEADANGAPYTTFTFKVRSDDGEESANNYTMMIDVTPVNDLPVGADVSVTTDEDVVYMFQPGDFTFIDVDGADFDGIRIVSLPGEGSLDAGGAVTAGAVIADVTTLNFTPVQDASGTPYTTFTFRVRNDDGEESAAGYTMTINVSPVNDLPEGDDELVTTDEDVPYTFQPGDFTFSDIEGDNFDGIRVVSLPGEGLLDVGGTAVSAGAVIADVTTLNFTPAQDASGTPYTTFTFKVRSDDGQESQDDYTMTINVLPVNDLPEGDNESVLTNEDEPYMFQPGDFTFTDVDGDNFAGIRVVSLPGQGALDAGGPVSAGDIIANVATLGFSPGTDENGTPYTSFTFKVRSDDGEESAADYIMTINVNPINDPPSFVKGPDQTINEDSGPQTVNGWATALDDGDPEATQSLEFEILGNTNPGLFAVQPAVNASGGRLTYEPAPNANGTATITVRIKDDGDDTPPNINIGNTETFDITVTPVNDPPQVNNSNGKTQYIESPGMPFVNVDGAITVIDIDNANLVSGEVVFTDTYIKGEDALSFVPGSTGVAGVFDEDTGVLALSGNRPVNQYQIALSSVLYVNSAGENPTAGDREITFSVSDGDLSGADTKIVTVVTVNAPPELVNGDIDDVTVDEDAPDFTIQLFNVFEDAEDLDTDLVFAVESNTNPSLVSTSIAPATGILTLDFTENAFGMTDLTVSATDTDNESTNTTFTVTVNAVNDKPETTGIPDVNVDEDSPNTVIVLWDHFEDIDNDDDELLFTKVPPEFTGLFSDITINNVTGILTLDYNANAYGSESITIRATDPDGLTEDATFTVNVAPINDAPTLDVIADPAPIDEDAPEQVINLTGITAGPNETQTLTVTASTDATGLLTVSPVEYTSPQNTGVLRFTPVANASGTADIQVCVSDNGPQTPPNEHQLCRTFTVVVNPVNDNPTINPIPDPGTIFVNAGEQCVQLSGISAGPGENQTISISAFSGNVSLISNPVGPIIYTSPDATGQVCYTPLPDQFGTATIIVEVDDNEGGTTLETFDVVVSPINQEPTIDQVGDIVIDEDATPDPLPLTGISPGLDEIQELTIELLSDNTDLFDPAGSSLSVNYTQGADEAVLLYTPIANANGEANITVRLTDNGPGDPPNDNQKDMTFKITVNAINDSPTLDEIPDQGIFDIGEAPAPVNLTGISEGPGEDQNVNITFSSDNAALVDPAKILVEFDPANDFGLLNYVIEPSLEGEANITVCVNDDGPGDAPNENSFCRTFKVTVSGAPDLEITNANLSINDVSRGQLFHVNSSIRNNGNENVESTFINYYLSSDDVFDDGSDDLIGILPIGPVSSDGVGNNWRSDGLRVSESTPAGTYFIIVVVDKTNNIPELNENNNIFVIQINVNSNRFPEIEYNNAPPLLQFDDQFINYRVVVTDDELRTDNPVEFFYRGISSDKDFTRRSAEEIEESLFQFTIDREQFLDDPIGLEFYFSVTDIGNLTNQTELAHTYEQYNDPGLTFDNLRFGSGLGDYQMVSVPLDLDQTSPDDVFADDFGPYNKENWRVIRFQGDGNVENKEGLEEIAPGNAYWLIVKDQPATPVTSGPGITTQVTKEAPFVISLRQGWNQIGSPYNFNVSWSDVISYNENPVGVKTVLREYESGYVESDVLRAFGGAFVESDVNIDLKIPVIRNNDVQNGRFAGNGATANHAGEWEVKVDLITSQFNSRINGFGMKSGASYGNDRYDASSSPELDFLGAVELRFDHPAHAQKSFAKDIRPVASAEIWEFSIDAPGTGFATMQWGDIREQIGDNELYLYDVGKGTVIDMLATTSYEVDLSSSKAFKVYYGTPDYIDENLKPENIYLGRSYPNPFTNFTQIPFSLAESETNYQLELSIFNLMGQKVKALASGEFEPGFYELEWNGKNEKGDKQPSGVYLYRLVVKSQGGQDQSFYGRSILR